MGCGQSKILIYHRKSRAEKNSKHNWEGDDSDPSDSHPEEGGARETGGNDRIPDRNDPDRSSDSPESEHLHSLADQSDISTSQIDFFRMLDEKIENGPDYEEDDIEREQERQRLRRLLQDWLRRPQLDTQRFPTAYQQCPPTRPPPRICPRPALYPQTRGYVQSRSASVETGDYWDSYSEPQYNPNWNDHRLREHQDHYNTATQQESQHHYPRLIMTQAQYMPAMETQDMYARRPILAKASNRAVSFDANMYNRGPSMEPQDMTMTGMNSSEYCPRREMNYGPYSSPYLQGPDNAMPYAAAGQEQMQYVSRPPPREMPPLQGVPGPPHGSPRPLSVRLPSSVMWRRPRGPVTELV